MLEDSSRSGRSGSKLDETSEGPIVYTAAAAACYSSPGTLKVPSTINAIKGHPKVERYRPAAAASTGGARGQGPGASTSSDEAVEVAMQPAALPVSARGRRLTGMEKMLRARAAMERRSRESSEESRVDVRGPFVLSGLMILSAASYLAYATYHHLLVPRHYYPPRVSSSPAFDEMWHLSLLLAVLLSCAALATYALCFRSHVDVPAAKAQVPPAPLAFADAKANRPAVGVARSKTKFRSKGAKVYVGTNHFGAAFARTSL